MTRTRPNRFALACVLAFLAVAAAAGPAHAQSIVQLPGAAGCITGDGDANPTCTATSPIGSPQDIVALGTHVYILDAQSDRIDVYDRDTATGALTRRVAGPNSCIADDAEGTPCTEARWLQNIGVMTPSPDGTRLYVGFEDDGESSDGVTTLVRDPATGGLTQASDLSSCIAGNLEGTCALADTFFGPPDAIAVSPDGSDVYVVGTTPANGSSSGYVSLFDAGPAGLAEHDAGDGGCARGTDDEVCLAVDAMDNSSSGVTLSPDGRNVYVTADGTGAVVGFTRAADGALGLIDGPDGCLQIPDGPQLRVTLDGCRESSRLGADPVPIAFASDSRGYVGGPGFVALLTRDPVTGGLTTPGSCVASDLQALPPCTLVQDLAGLSDLELSPAGTTLLAGAVQGRGLHVFELAANGNLVQPPGSCIATGGQSQTQSTCAFPRGFLAIEGPQEFGPGAVALGPGGPFVYAASANVFPDAPGVLAARRTLFAAVCEDATVDVAPGAGVTLPLSCADGDDDPVEVTIVKPPAQGTLGALDQGAQTVAYTAPPAAGNETLMFKATSDGVDSALATITIRVVAPAPPPPPPPPVAPPPPPPPPPAGPGDRDGDGIPDALDTSDASVGPTVGETAVARVVSGVVYIKVSGSSRSTRQASGTPAGFRPLKGAEIIPIGSTLHTERGRVALTTASSLQSGPSRPTQRSLFYRGIFQIKQRRAAQPVTELALTSSNFAKQCSSASAAQGAQAASAGGSRQSKKVVSRLWGNGKGRFRTRGRNSTATVRGTLWRTDERCDGTLTRVREGSVTVRDLRLGTTVTVNAPRAYLARAKRAAVKKTQRP